MAVGDVRFFVKEEGYTEIKDKLKDSGPWLGEPYHEGMERIGNIGAAAVRFAAPVGRTAKTENNIRAVVSKAKIPRFVRIDELATNPRSGYPYPRLLEFSPYAQSRYKAGTNKHALWMKNAIIAIVPDIDDIFAETADEVEKRWAQ